MSTKHIRNASDLVRFRASLRIDCLGCGNARTVDGYELARTAGTGPLASLGRRLRCSRCGAKEGQLTILPPP